MRFLLPLLLLLTSTSLFCQVQAEADLYGRWRILGNFKEGKQTLRALQDTLKNPKHYYITYREDGTYESDVVSLSYGHRGKKMNGEWTIDLETQTLTSIRTLSRKEKRKIPANFVTKDEKGVFHLLPVSYAIVHYDKHKLILYDAFHKTYNIRIR